MMFFGRNGTKVPFTTQCTQTFDHVKINKTPYICAFEVKDVRKNNPKNNPTDSVLFYYYYYYWSHLKTIGTLFMIVHDAIRSPNIEGTHRPGIHWRAWWSSPCHEGSLSFLAKDLGQVWVHAKVLTTSLVSGFSIAIEPHLIQMHWSLVLRRPGCNLSTDPANL